MRKMLLLLRGMVKNDQTFKNFEEKVRENEKMRKWLDFQQTISGRKSP